MSIFSSNLKHLRKNEGRSQELMAEELGIKRSTLSAYETGSAEPNIKLLQKIARYLNTSVDDLLSKELSELSDDSLLAAKASFIEGEKLRVLPITVESDNKENIELVPVLASAGYLNGYADPEYISSLQRFRLPMLPAGTFRAFEIKGDSMLPVAPGSIVVAEYVVNWKEIYSNKTYIVTTQQEGVVFKRVINNIETDRSLMMVSDNPVYESYNVKIEDVLEAWIAKAIITLDMPTTSSTLDNLTSVVKQLQEDVNRLKGH